MSDNDSGKPPADFVPEGHVVRGSDQAKGDDLVFVDDGEVIDVFEPDDHEGRALRDDLHRHFGGAEGFAQASADLSEAVGIFDPSGEIGNHLEGMTRSEENAAIKEMVAEWRGILASPEKAQAVLSKLYAHPNEEPAKTYFSGRGSEAMKDAMWRLMQVAHGETPVPRNLHPWKDGNRY